MMRNLFATFALFLSVLIFAQANPFAGDNTDNSSPNRYANPQAVPKKDNKPNDHASDKAFVATDTNRAGGIGNPDAVPIDEYIPVFILIALGLIVYQTRSVKKVQS